LKFIIFIFLLISCNPKEKTTQDNARPPSLYKWNSEGLLESPLNIVLAEEFLPLMANEEQDTSGLNAIELMAKKWDDAHPILDFFSLPFTVGQNRIYTNLDDYLEDGEIGIYFSKGWWRELSPSALAVTQFWGLRKNAGTPDEYLELVHGDILVNFSDYDYFLDSNRKNFDLLTVLFHEMGHLIGFQHVNNPNIQSVMSPYLDRGEMKRSLTEFDLTTLLKHYPLITPSSSSKSSLLNIETSDTLEKHIIELEKDGTCKHYLNGQLIYSP
jgi:hypothetical protein